jgi:hypothetical protein
LRPATAAAAQTLTAPTAGLLMARNGDLATGSGMRFPLPPVPDQLPELAVELLRIEPLVKRLQSAVLELRDGDRHGLMVVVGGKPDSCWLSHLDREVEGIEAEKELLAWNHGALVVRTMPPAQARAISWMWTLPRLSELPVSWLRPAAVFQHLLELPGQVAAVIDRGDEPAALLLDQGEPVLLYSHRKAHLTQGEFIDFLSASGRLTVGWSKAESERDVLFHSAGSPR